MSKQSLWSPASWRQHLNLQLLPYADHQQLSEIENSLSQKSSLIFPTQIEMLKNCLAETAIGKYFVLQVGDCAEKFAETTFQSSA